MNIRKLSDEQLVEKVRSEDKELYSHIIIRYQEKLYRYVMYLVHNDQQSIDIVQEALIKAYINLQSFNTAKNFSSWLYRITHNAAMNEVKKYQKEISLTANFEVKDARNIEEDLEKKEIITMTHKCLDKLPIMYSEPLILHFLEDKSYDEVSDILHLPLGTVGTRINRAKSLMKHICQNIR